MSSLRRVRGRLRIVTAMVVGYWFVLFISTHVPAEAVRHIGHYDKVLHFLAYAGLAFLMAWAFARSSPLTLKTYFSILGVIAIYGICDELLQMIPGINRTADVKDWIADMAGASSALVFFALLANFGKKRAA
jgi:VanZ family protein